MKSIAIPATLLALLLAGSPTAAEYGVQSQENAMVERGGNTDGSMDLMIENRGELIEIRLVGSAEEPLRVEYELVVEGPSKTVHHGKSTLSGGREQILSTVKIAASDEFCAKLHVVEEGGREYALQRGTCA